MAISSTSRIRRGLFTQGDVIRKHQPRGDLEKLSQLAHLKGEARRISTGDRSGIAAPRGAGHIRIQSYDFRSLVRLGALVHWEKDPTSVFALIGPKVPVTKIGTQTRSVGGEAADIADLIARRDLEKRPTRRRALIDARLGQGKFRRQLLAKWDNACAVTGASVQEALRASHIKPWVRSTDQQRLDPNNGLPLVGTLDALFDRGLISFDNSGRMLISDRVKKNQRQILHLRGQLRLALNEKQVDFLAFHRNECFRG